MSELVHDDAAERRAGALSVGALVDGVACSVIEGLGAFPVSVSRGL
jgi:hypothetical protein